GAAVTNLSHSASFHSSEWIAPSNPGIKHLEPRGPLGRHCVVVNFLDKIVEALGLVWDSVKQGGYGKVDW
ncbi:hypothetical protein, partial [Rhodovulum imhoffii]|uniref:hypothetical protein n=1 Tax=Rhodovulum imhoffii TaxID=365340 RepID=UPI001B87BBD4